jgi:hypothetical protein
MCLHVTFTLDIFSQQYLPFGTGLATSARRADVQILLAKYLLHVFMGYAT